MNSTVETILLYTIAAGFLSIVYGFLTGKNIEIKVGNSLELKDIPPGTSIHNVELIPGNGAKLARSAGSSVTISGLVILFSEQ